VLVRQAEAQALAATLAIQLPPQELE